MMNVRPIVEWFRKLSLNVIALSMVILAASLIFLALAISSFTLQLALVRRDLPKMLDRIDKQLSDVNKAMNKAENTGQSFQTGVNKGISQGVVEVPLGTVAKVGYTLSDTAAKTGKQTLSFWQVVKDRMFFWQKKEPATPESTTKK